VDGEPAIDGETTRRSTPAKTTASMAPTAILRPSANSPAASIHRGDVG
jgi:hypothetical protein